MVTHVRILMILAAGAALASCGGRQPGTVALARATPAGAAPAGADWRKIATAADRERLRNWRQSWLAANAAARGADAGAMTKEGGLFLPDRALDDAVPPAGAYHCRVFKLGARGSGQRPFTAYPYFDCRVDDKGEVVNFSKTGGSQRPVGLIFRDGGARGVFLGTMMLGDETSALQYGRDASRDMAGFVERIGERRWRIVLPEPRFESRLDLIELVPAG